ncbi:MAG: hypothetical protein R2860_06795 [Desulfobacterales bacterium]
MKKGKMLFPLIVGFFMPVFRKYTLSGCDDSSNHDDSTGFDVGSSLEEEPIEVVNGGFETGDLPAGQSQPAINFTCGPLFRILCLYGGWRGWPLEGRIFNKYCLYRAKSGYSVSYKCVKAAFVILLFGCGRS